MRLSFDEKKNNFRDRNAQKRILTYQHHGGTYHQADTLDLKTLV